MEQLTVRANGAAFHVARTGAGPPLVLLHGWPEFWLTFEPLMLRLADRYTLFAPDLRGFGDSDKPDGPFGPDQHAADMLALMDALHLPRVGAVGHDVGGATMQSMARMAPQRLCGLFLFDFVYPGIGARMAEPERLNNIWYRSFHQMPMAAALVGATRESCRAGFLRASTCAEDAGAGKSGTAARDKNRRSRVASLKLWPGSAASGQPAQRFDRSGQCGTGNANPVLT
jgi:pimeloyl-ACP methyl ester carboxylesterase